MKRSRKTLFALLLALVMTLGLAATAWATGGDGNGGQLVVTPESNENVQPEVRPGAVIVVENNVTCEIPFTKTVKLGGNTAPGKTDFTLEIFDIGNSNKGEYKDVTCTAAVTTNGAGSYDGKLVISGPKNQVKEFVREGFYVREVNNNLSGWTYSDAVWHVWPSREAEDENGIPKMNIYSTGNGEGAAVEQMTFENTYTYNHTTHARRPAEQPNTPETETAITAPKTFDAGVALYGVSALLSLTGTALVIKRKNG